MRHSRQGPAAGWRRRARMRNVLQCRCHPRSCRGPRDWRAGARQRDRRCRRGRRRPHPLGGIGQGRGDGQGERNGASEPARCGRHSGTGQGDLTQLSEPPLRTGSDQMSHLPTVCSRRAEPSRPAARGFGRATAGRIGASPLSRAPERMRAPNAQYPMAAQTPLALACPGRGAARPMCGSNVPAARAQHPVTRGRRRLCSGDLALKRPGAVPPPDRPSTAPRIGRAPCRSAATRTWCRPAW